MTKKDYSFYEDQKSRRLSVCIDKEENLTSSDLRFQRRYAEDALDLRSIPFSNKSDIFESIDHELTSESEVESVSELSCSSSVGLGYESEDPCNDQNSASWPNLSLICERYQLSDRAGAAVANAVLQDLQKIVQIPALNSLLVDRSKLRRERKKFRQEALLKDEINISEINAIYTDGRKDVTLVQDRNKRKLVTEELYAVIGEPETLYLTHVTPENGKGRVIANA